MFSSNHITLANQTDSSQRAAPCRYRHPSDAFSIRHKSWTPSEIRPLAIRLVETSLMIDWEVPEDCTVAIRQALKIKQEIQMMIMNS